MKQLSWILPEALRERTPSRKDGISREEELQKKMEMVRLIREKAAKMSLDESLALPTAITFMHRFLTVKSLKVYEPVEVACTALFLAAKVATCPRRLSEFVARFFDLRKDEQMHDNKKKRIMVVERDMITALGFDFTVENPKSLFRQKMQCLGLIDRIQGALKGTAYALLDDAACTPLFLHYPMEQIIDAVLYIALHVEAKKQEDVILPEEDDRRLLGSFGTPYVTILAIMDDLKGFCRRCGLRSLVADFSPPPWAHKFAAATAPYLAAPATAASLAGATAPTEPSSLGPGVPPLPHLHHPHHHHHHHHLHQHSGGAPVPPYTANPAPPHWPPEPHPPPPPPAAHRGGAPSHPPPGGPPVPPWPPYASAGPPPGAALPGPVGPPAAAVPTPPSDLLSDSRKRSRDPGDLQLPEEPPSKSPYEELGHKGGKGSSWPVPYGWAQPPPDGSWKGKGKGMWGKGPPLPARHPAYDPAPPPPPPPPQVPPGWPAPYPDSWAEHGQWYPPPAAW